MRDGGEARRAGLHDPFLPVRVRTAVSIVWDCLQTWSDLADGQVAVPLRQRAVRTYGS